MLYPELAPIQKVVLFLLIVLLGLVKSSGSHFQRIALLNSTDPDRPKNDKATILTDTIQVLKDLTAEVNRLKADCTELSEESHEVIVYIYG